MGGADRREVSMVEGGDLRLVQTLGQGYDAGIDDTQRQVAVSILDVPATREIRAGRRLDAVGTGPDVIEEDEPGVGS